jgi:hypothetical protein
MTRVATTAAILAFVLLLGAGNTALGQSAHEQHHPQQPAQQGMPMQPGMMGPGMMGPGMMGPGMMGPGMMGPGMMGPGMMGPGMMGPGMMGQGMGPGMVMGPMMGMGPGMMGPPMMGWGWGAQPVNLNLSANDVQSHLERWIAMTGNPHVKVGSVTEKDDTITAEIVTTGQGDLVQRFAVDRRTGMYSPVQ